MNYDTDLVLDEEGNIQLREEWYIIIRKERRQFKKDIKEFLEKNITVGKRLKGHLPLFYAGNKILHGLGVLYEIREKHKDGKTLALIGVEAEVKTDEKNGSLTESFSNKLRFYNPSSIGEYVPDKNIAGKFLNYVRSKHVKPQK